MENNKLRIGFYIIAVAFAVFALYFLFTKNYATLKLNDEHNSGESSTYKVKYSEVKNTDNSFVDVIYEELFEMEAPSSQGQYESIAYYLVLFGSVIIVVGLYFFYKNDNIIVTILGSASVLLGSLLFFVSISAIKKEITSTLGGFGVFLKEYYSIDTTSVTLMAVSLLFTCALLLIGYFLKKDILLFNNGLASNPYQSQPNGYQPQPNGYQPQPNGYQPQNVVDKKREKGTYWVCQNCGEENDLEYKTCPECGKRRN